MEELEKKEQLEKREQAQQNPGGKSVDLNSLYVEFNMCKDKMSQIINLMYNELADIVRKNNT